MHFSLKKAFKTFNVLKHYSTISIFFKQVYTNQILWAWYITLLKCTRLKCWFIPSVFKKVFWTILAKNKVKIIVNIPWFVIRKRTFTSEQKWHVGKLRSWVIIIVPHVKWTVLYFYSCHSNGALKTTLSVLFFIFLTALSAKLI